jgi:chemotaxis signal transduction protein
MSTRFVATAPPAALAATTAATTAAAAPTPTAESQPAPATGTAVLLPTARSARVPTAFALPAPRRPEPVASEESDAEDDAGAPTQPNGYVVFALGDACFAVPIDEVRAVIRTERLDLLPGGARPRYGRGVALVDVRGRAIPVVDLRTDPSAPGEVLLPLYRHHVGLVVDRVVSVSSSSELVPEPDGLPDVLPDYAQGVLRPADGGAPVLLVALPDAESLQG